MAETMTLQQIHETTSRKQTAINNIQATFKTQQQAIVDIKTAIVDIRTSINHIIHSVSEIATKLGFEITLPPLLPLSPTSPNLLPVATAISTITSLPSDHNSPINAPPSLVSILIPSCAVDSGKDSTSRGTNTSTMPPKFEQHFSSVETKSATKLLNKTLHGVSGFKQACIGIKDDEPMKVAIKRGSSISNETYPAVYSLGTGPFEVLRVRQPSYPKLLKSQVWTDELTEPKLFGFMLERCQEKILAKVFLIFDPGGDAINVRVSFQIWPKYNVANAYFSLSALGNFLDLTNGSYTGWYKIMPFSITETCGANSIKIKYVFLISIICLTINTFITILSAAKISFTHTPGGTELSYKPKKCFLVNVIGVITYLTSPTGIILIVSVLEWIEWFQCIQFDTDYKDSEIYRRDMSGKEDCHSMVRLESFGLILQSIVLGYISVRLEKIYRKWRAGFVWEISIFNMSHYYTAMVIQSCVERNAEHHSEGLLRNGTAIKPLSEYWRITECPNEEVENHVWNLNNLPRILGSMLAIISADISEQPNLLHILVTRFSPSLLRKESFLMYRWFQNVDEFIVTFSRAYHLCSNYGFNLAEPVKVASTPTPLFTIISGCMTQLLSLNSSNLPSAIISHTTASSSITAHIEIPMSTVLTFSTSSLQLGSSKSCNNFHLAKLLSTIAYSQNLDESKPLVFDPGGNINLECLFMVQLHGDAKLNHCPGSTTPIPQSPTSDLEDKVVFEGSVMIRIKRAHNIIGCKDAINIIIWVQQQYS